MLSVYIKPSANHALASSHSLKKINIYKLSLKLISYEPCVILPTFQNKFSYSNACYNHQCIQVCLHRGKEKDFVEEKFWIKTFHFENDLNLSILLILGFETLSLKLSNNFLLLKDGHPKLVDLLTCLNVYV